MAAYTIYGGELSLFTRKLEAACIFYGADYQLQAKTPANRELVETRSGTHQVPVLHTPENWMVADTTPLLGLLDSRFPDRQLIPAGAMGLLVHLLEDYFDEWVARVMVHYRWHYSESAKFASLKMAAGNQAVAEQMLNWGPRACRATGTDSPDQQQAAEAEYLRLMAGVEQQLQSTPFLLGHRPTALDCIVLGGLRAHTNMDPDPKLAIAQYSTVVGWAEQQADASAAEPWGELAELPLSTEFAQLVLQEMAQTYQPFLLANAKALAAGAKAFHLPIYGEEVSYLTRPYPETARQMLLTRLQSLTAIERNKALQLLEEHQLQALFQL